MRDVLQVSYTSFRQSLARIGVADGGIPDRPVGLTAIGASYPPPGQANHPCAPTNSSSIDCGPLAYWGQ